MNRILLECNIIYYANEKLRYKFEDLTLAIHPSWKPLRSLRDREFDSYKAQYLHYATEIMHPSKAIEKLYLDCDNENHLYIALNMCKKAETHLEWPGDKLHEVTL